MRPVVAALSSENLTVNFCTGSNQLSKASLHSPVEIPFERLFRGTSEVKFAFYILKNRKPLVLKLTKCRIAKEM